ncbi:MAG: ribosome recycling factor [Verrucomicrobia bacterium RIFCSPHIGHO2_12_FULL_41_10]|nr:MAG: ribosome recycling factor [Verrucomicrobia bacterium RIFCSPHIGHO2_12_FULL_41_10]HLB33175.1 ribosome recycling factor [Chthoniobacterales bacterium]
MSAEEILFAGEEGMDKALEFMIHEFAAVRTGKASPILVETIDVHTYGSSMKLKQLALITAPEGRLLVIQPFDAGTLKDIEKAILESNVGITPTIDGKIIRLRIPELSEERRKDLVRTVGKISEETRVRIRSSRRDAMDQVKKLQKAGTITEDELERSEKEIQKLTDKFVASVDEHVSHKEAELMKV